MFDPELDDFKKRLDLRQYMAAQGYFLDKRESSKRCSIMRGPNDDKLIVIIGPKAPHYWIYCSIRDLQDNGTVIDFISHRKRLSLGQIRKELRPWVGRHSPSLPVFPTLQTALTDIAAVELAYNRMKVADHHAYLEEERRVPGELLRSERFAGRVRMDEHGNAIFPHFQAGGLCGWEKKNRGFTGFASGGMKGLWEAHDRPDDDALVFTESAIDALSYAALFPNEHARYRSIGGQVNDRQPDLIRTAIMELPDGGNVIAAMDNDEAGRKLAGIVATALAESGRSSLTFRLHLPEQSGADWNNVLQNSFSIARHEIVGPS